MEKLAALADTLHKISGILNEAIGGTSIDQDRFFDQASQSINSLALYAEEILAEMQLLLQAKSPDVTLEHLVDGKIVLFPKIPVSREAHHADRA